MGTKMTKLERQIIRELLHDINNMLCVCSGYMDILLGTYLTPSQVHIIETIKKAIDRIGMLMKKAGDDLTEKGSHEDNGDSEQVSH
jgi:hypothetical protein